MAAENNLFIEKDIDGLTVLTVSIVPKINECFCCFKQECDKEVPFFHLDILEEQDRAIYTSQEYGSTILIYLTKYDFNYVTQYLINKDDLISLPEVR